MLIIGERINVITKVQREAMMSRDKGPIQEMAKDQVKNGAGMLDINIGPAEDDGPGLMDWMVKTVQEVAQVPLCLDTTNPEAMKAGLKAHDNTWGRALINSASGEEERLNAMMPLAGKYNSLIIGLTLNKQGIPALAEERCEIAAEIMGKAMEDGVPMEDIYLDPLILPVPFSQDKCLESIRAIRLFKEMNDPAMKTVVGLSNISNGAPKHMRPIINRVFTALLMYEGLDSAIIDPNEKEMMDVIKTVDILMGKTLYAHSYLEM
jgi:5-methyltetrahydrofolate corrinoid/iron sulfur protein methyltransferase